LYSHAEGSFTTAEGSYSHAEGDTTKSLGTASHTEGLGTIASGSYQLAIGRYNLRGNTTSLFVIGAGTADASASRRDLARFEQGSGLGSDRLEITGSLSQGNSSNLASGIYSHAQGETNTASGRYAHAEGVTTTASGWHSHAEGDTTTSSGNASHAEGVGSESVGYGSHASGYFVIASGSNIGQNVVGKYNLRGNDFSLFVVGNGTATANASRSDIFRVNTSQVEVTGSLALSTPTFTNDNTQILTRDSASGVVEYSDNASANIVNHGVIYAMNSFNYLV
jgi:hypothetical protein